MENLKKLTLNSMTISGPSFTTICTIQTLEYLDLMFCGIEHDNPLRNCTITNLCFLDLSFCKCITDHIFSKIVQFCSTLESLKVAYCNSLTMASFQQIHKFKNLKKLNSSLLKVTDIVLANSNDLDILDCTGVDTFTIDGIIAYTEKNDPFSHNFLFFLSAKY